MHTHLLTDPALALFTSVAFTLVSHAASGADATGIPIKEVTVFKDGHALVMHEGAMAVGQDGRVVLDELPMPVLGTFWPFSLDAKLVSVTAGMRTEETIRPARTLYDMILANPGASVTVHETTGEPYSAVIAKPVEQEKSSSHAPSPESLQYAPQPSVPEVILLQTEHGMRAVPLGRITHLVFEGPFVSTLKTETEIDRLTLALAWNGAAQPTADVGMMYLQKGLRWIPGYKVEIDGAGKAIITLQATLINELTDLEGVTAHLVIGVPEFFFKDTLDPMAVQNTLANLSQYFQSGQMGQIMGNVVMTQSARRGEYAAAPPQGSGNVPEVVGEGGHEDLFVFSVSNITLKKGERMVMPVTTFELDYRDHYTLDLPIAPPPEVRQHFSSNQQQELAQLLRAPKVMHNLCMRNTSKAPLTTAPALILKEGKVLSQGMMTYTAIGAEVKLPMTAALDVRHTRKDVETGRVPDAVEWQRNKYGRVDFKGTVTLTNFKTEAVEIEVIRHVLGNASSADHEGKVEMVNMLEDLEQAVDAAMPAWWQWHNWPYWWYRFNGIGRITWNVKLQPSERVDLGYTWNYFWN